MEQLSQEEISSVCNFIEQNELDYDIINNGISKFQIFSIDGTIFYFYKLDDKYLLIKTHKDKITENGKHDPKQFEYLPPFTNINDILKLLAKYDNSIVKSYWDMVNDTTELACVNYDPNWTDVIPIDLNYKECYIDGGVEDGYKYLKYTNDSYKPIINNPINQLNISNTLNELYFEIYLISGIPKRESYLVKIKSNEDYIFKEYINYVISTKKGIKLFLKTLFNDVKIYKN